MQIVFAFFFCLEKSVVKDSGYATSEERENEEGKLKDRYKGILGIAKAR